MEQGNPWFFPRHRMYQHRNTVCTLQQWTHSTNHSVDFLHHHFQTPASKKCLKIIKTLCQSLDFQAKLTTTHICARHYAFKTVIHIEISTVHRQGTQKQDKEGTDLSRFKHQEIISNSETHPQQVQDQIGRVFTISVGWGTVWARNFPLRFTRWKRLKIGIYMHKINDAHKI